MRLGFGLSLIAALLALSSLTSATSSQHRAQLVGRISLSDDDPRFGGLSGLVVQAQGTRFIALSDRGTLVQGSLNRTDGRLVGYGPLHLSSLKNTDNSRLTRREADPEGLALRGDGRMYVSFEGYHRIWTYRGPESEAAWLPRHPDFRHLQNNSSLEALAIGPDGALYTMPERSGRKDWPFPVYRYANGQWSKPFTLPRSDDFLPVGADFGPDGRFYVLERDFRGILGFRSRVRRFDLTPQGLRNEEVLMQSRSGRHDNLEGLSVWQDDAGAIRLTMVSDDNFNRIQRTEIVEYRLSE